MTKRRSEDPHQPLHVAMQSEKDFQECAVRLKALADPDRLKIVNSLLQGDKSVSSLAEEMVAPIDKISHHLSVLRAARLVETRKQGRFIIYSLPPDISLCENREDSTKTIDLGCCRLDIVQLEVPAKGNKGNLRNRGSASSAKE